MKKYIISSIFVSLLAACGDNPEKNTVETDSSGKVNKEAAAIRSATSFLMDYDALEQLYGNDNWLLVNGRDSSYLYFSRVNKFIVNTYAYIREKGDSAKVQYGAMQVNGDQVNWIVNNTPVHLKSATRTRAVWESDGKDSLLYEFIRIDQDKIKLTYPDKHTVIMEKMLPLSLFLVRSQYDFANGTHYAFDTTQFNRKK